MNYLFLDNGFEEIEAVTTIDLLRRAKIALTTVSVTGNPMVLGAHNIAVEADGLIEKIDFSDAEMLILPGGQPGVSNLQANDTLMALVKDYAANGGKVAAICASPAIVLAPMGMLNGRQAVCYPGMETSDEAIQWADGDVAIDGNVTTGNGPASAAEFAFALVEQSMGRDRFLEIGEQMLFA